MSLIIFGVYDALEDCREPGFWELGEGNSLKGCSCTYRKITTVLRACSEMLNFASCKHYFIIQLMHSII